jgi:hypothetical protein
LLRFKTPELEHNAKRLGFTTGALRACLAGDDLAAAERRVKELRKKCQKAFHKLALQLHPDHNEGDPAKAEEFKLLSLAYNEVETFFSKVKLAPRPKAPPPRPMGVPVVVVNTGTGWRPHRVQVFTTSNSTTGTSTAFSANWWER